MSAKIMNLTFLSNFVELFLVVMVKMMMMMMMMGVLELILKIFFFNQFKGRSISANTSVEVQRPG